MSYPNFDDLPFNARPDLSPYLIHLTKNTAGKDGNSALDNLISILKSGEIRGSTSKGFIKGPNPATCFMDVPFQALKYVLTPEDTDPHHPRYEPYGIVIQKQSAYKKGCRPVLYLSDAEVKTIGLAREELWRVVKFEVKKETWISWLHEREWRCKGAFRLPSKFVGVLVRNTRDVNKLHEQLTKHSKIFKCHPRSVIPLSIVCQGLLKH